MNQNEIQPEIDEELAEAGKLFIKAVEAQASRAGFARALNSLPNDAVTNPPNNRYLYQSLKYFILNLFNMKLLSGKLASVTSTALLILVVVFGLGTWYLSGKNQQLVSGEGASPMVANTTVTQDSAVYGQMTGLGTGESMVAKVAGSVRSALMPAPAPDYYPYYNPTPSAGDTREFNKIYYRAILKTRQVETMGRRIETIVRGYSGRVDNSSINYQYAYISFVLPKDKYETFKDELRSLVGSRFFEENVSTQNLLGQKQNIEEQHANVSDNLDEAQAERAKLVKTHNAALASLTSQRSKIINELAALNQEMTTDTIRLQQIEKQKTYLVGERNRLSGLITAENNNYQNQLQNIDSQIKYLQTGIKTIEKQDQKLLENVETVNGTITLRWISVWSIINLYIPHFGFWLVLVAVVLFFIKAHWGKKVEVVEIK